VTTTPRDAIGLSDRLRYTADNGIPDFTNAKLLNEAATALDALQARVKELEAKAAALFWSIPDDIAAQIKCGDLQKRAAELFAAESRATSAEQERDEAYELAAGRWKPVGFGWGDIYEVSSLGHVRRIGSNALIGTVSGNGYVRVQLSRAGTTETFLIHKLVADAFIGPRPDGHHIDHINGVRDDNRFVNLRYCSPQQNISYTVERGANAVADRNGASVLTADQVRAIRQAKSEGGRYWGAARIAKELGVHESTVRKAASGKYYSALRIRRLAAGTEKEGKE
jgi:hypothetical protein